MSEITTAFVGLDVHKDSIAIAVAQPGRAAPRFLGTTGPVLAEVEKALSHCGTPPQLLIVYEAGPCGYGLARQLCARGYRCEVIAPTLIPRKPGDRIKTDRRDALALAHFARAGDLTPVAVPQEPDEAIRDLSRAREDAVRARLKARQQLKAMLLRHGQRYTGKKSWNAAHERWLAALGFSHPAQNIAFLEYHAMREHDEGNPRKFYVGIQAMISDSRQRQPRDVPMQCGNQPANIRMIHRRHKLRAPRSPSRVMQQLHNLSTIQAPEPTARIPLAPLDTRGPYQNL